MKSEKEIGAHPPFEPMGILFQHTGRLVRGAILMAFEHRSRAVGRNPAWLNAAADLRFLGTSGTHDTILHFQAPRLADVIPRLYEQLAFDFPGLNSDRPPGEKTGFDLLTDAVADITRQEEDSVRFDSHLLLNLLRFGKLFNGTYQAMGFVLGGQEEPSAFLNRETLVSAERLKRETPSPIRVRIVGKLDMLRDSTQSFALQLDDRQELPATLLQGDMDSLKDLFKRRVLVLGQAFFRPSGRILRVDAEAILSGEGEPSFWSLMPKSHRRMTLPELRQPQGPRTGAAAIKGQWPGDETDEEVEEALKELSR